MPDAFSTLRILDFYPGLWAWTHTTVDAVRVADLEGERVREQLKLQVKSPREYVKSLDVQLTVEVTPRWHLARLHELSQKTNQFNCNVARLSEVAMARLMASDMSRVVAISLRDRLSDSGVVGLVVAELSADRLRISELAISCRALGRRVEDTMIAAALTAILDDLPASTVEFMYRAAPRNRPALDWLSRFTGQVVADEGTVILSSDAVKSIMNEAIVNVEKKHG
jgi:FkbH-like protein